MKKFRAILLAAIVSISVGLQADEPVESEGNADDRFLLKTRKAEERPGLFRSPRRQCHAWGEVKKESKAEPENEEEGEDGSDASRASRQE